jgi:hypothetical protein
MIPPTREGSALLPLIPHSVHGKMKRAERFGHLSFVAYNVRTPNEWFSLDLYTELIVQSYLA